MPVTVKIDVMLKDEILDPQGQALERSLPQLGFAGVSSVRVGKHIELVVDDSEDLDARVNEIAGKLLANPVIETFTYRLEPGVSGAQAPGQPGVSGAQAPGQPGVSGAQAPGQR